jgi:hypothetical protein
MHNTQHGPLRLADAVVGHEQRDKMTIHERLANSHPSLQRGMVWCRTCGRIKRVDSASALRSGWPKCCGYTMTIDSPEEQKRLSSSVG